MSLADELSTEEIRALLQLKIRETIAKHGCPGYFLHPGEQGAREHDGTR